MSYPNNTQNYIISYDLNGNVPTHAAVDKHVAKISVEYGRILETVWYVRSSMTTKAVFDHMDSIMSANDRLIVIEAKDAWFRNLLLTDVAFQQAWSLAA